MKEKTRRWKSPAHLSRALTTLALILVATCLPSSGCCPGQVCVPRLCPQRLLWAWLGRCCLDAYGSQKSRSWCHGGSDDRSDTLALWSLASAPRAAGVGSPQEGWLSSAESTALGHHFRPSFLVNVQNPCSTECTKTGGTAVVCLRCRLRPAPPSPVGQVLLFLPFLEKQNETQVLKTSHPVDCGDGIMGVCVLSQLIQMYT